MHSTGGPQGQPCAKKSTRGQAQQISRQAQHLSWGQARPEVQALPQRLVHFSTGATWPLAQLGHRLAQPLCGRRGLRPGTPTCSPRSGYPVGHSGSSTDESTVIRSLAGTEDLDSPCS